MPHHWVERHLRESGIGHTILRPTFFANNLGGEYRDDIRAERRLYLPSCAARVAFIDARDIAYPLTGSVSCLFSDVAAILSMALNKPIRHQSIMGFPITSLFIHTAGGFIRELASTSGQRTMALCGTGAAMLVAGTGFVLRGFRARRRSERC
ncbi:MAG: hypothetical protein H7203_07780 [Rhizobacter sp.]|nr:hypothetical protein [Burkholderiales bacterium]